MQDITLQINLSPGDVSYAGITVPALVNQHSDIKNRLLIVDCCRPQKTKLVNPDSKYPPVVYGQNVERIIDISESLKKNKVVTDVYYLKPGDALFKYLSKKYLNSVYECTHSAGGTANMGYWAAMEIPTTKYILHYDGDMLLHQQKGYSWAAEAMGYLADNADSVFAVPRVCPVLTGNAVELPSLHEGRPFEPFGKHWKSDWFSTRHFLFDKQKLSRFLPLVRGKLMLELLVRKYAKRAFPLDPEIMLHRSLAPRGVKKIILKNSAAWAIHPANKSRAFLDILPQMAAAVTAGKVPEAQRGYEDINLEAWINYFETAPQ